MAKRIVSLTSLTPVPIADATNLTNAQYFCAIQGTLAVQTIRIVEIYEGGLAGTSAPTNMIGSLDSAVAGTLVVGGCTDAPVDAGNSPLGTPVKVGNGTTTIPQRSSAFHLHNLSLNAFGGIVRLNWPLDQQAVIVGSTTVNASEYSISAFTGGVAGLIGFHMMYEPSVKGFVDYLPLNEYHDWHEQRQGGRLQNHMRRNAKAVCRIKWNDL